MHLFFHRILPLLLFFIGLSCSEKKDSSNTIEALPKTPTQIPTVKPENLPSPIKAKYLDSDSIAAPEVVPLKYEPTIIPAHPNVHPIGIPKVNQIPKDLHIVTLGKEVPMPEIIPAQPTVRRTYQPKPIPALPSRMRDVAVYDMQYLSADEGLPFGGASIIEDRKGNIWWGNRKEVIRYDGENFFHFTKEEGFGGGEVLMEDSKGNIWFGYNGLLGYYDGKNVVHFKEQKQKGARYFRWFSITEDSKGNIWLGARNGVFKYDGQNFTFFKKENGFTDYTKNKPGEVFDTRVSAIMEDSRGHIWWATKGSGVLRYDGKRIIHYTEKEGLISNYIGSIMEDSKGRIWLGGGSGGTTELMAKGLSIYNPDTTTPQSLGGTFTNYTTQEGLSANRIEDMVEDDWGKIWLATYANGLTCYDEKNFTHYTIKEGLSDDAVLGILKDSKKNIWLGLANSGQVMRFNPNGFKHVTEQQGLSKNWISGTLEDRKGNIWIGTSYGGLMKYDGQHFTKFSEKERLLKAFPRPLLEDKQGNIWFYVRDRGIQYFDGKKFNFIGKEQGLIYPYPDDAHQDKQGQIWITSFTLKGEQMITRYHSETKQITHFATGDKGVGSGRILEDKEQQLWFGGMGCILKYDPINDQLNYVFQLDVENSDWIHLLFEDDKDNLWFTMDSSQRVFKMKKSGGNSYISSYGKEQGFPELRNYSYPSIDHNKNIWLVKARDGVVVFPKGLENIDSPEMNWIQYDKADGLKSLRYYSRNHIDHKNQLWAYTDDAGITTLDLNTFELPTEAPKQISLSHIDIQGQFIGFERLTDSTYRNTLVFSTILNESFDSVPAFKNYPTNLKLPHDINHLTFHFSAIDWSAPHDIQYSFKMEGLDKEWSTASNKAEADYRSIPFGTYIFKVKAIGKAQVWSEPFEYTFTILPPWWRTWWAYSLYVLAALAIIYTVYRYILNRQLAEERAKQLQAMNQLKSRFYTNITHEFRTPLTVILGMAQEEKDFSKARKLITRNGKKLLHLINQLLDFSKLDSGKLKANYQQIEMVSFTQYIGESFQSLADKKYIRLMIYSELNQLWMDMDEEKYRQIISNLLSNAIKFTPESGKIILHLVQKEQQLQIKVKDNGIGIAKAELTHIFDRFYQVESTASKQGQGTGIGLALVRELVELLQGKIEAESDLNMGTIFSIYFPIRQTVGTRASNFEKIASPTVSPLVKNDLDIADANRLLEETMSAADDISKLLIIEDNADVVIYIQAILKDTYDLLFASNGAEGIQKAIEFVPDIIISDVMMPKKNGFEVVETLKQDERTSHIPIVLLTAKATQQDKIEGLKYGADAYLMKPFDKEELLIRLKNLIEVRQQLQAKYALQFQAKAAVSDTSSTLSLEEQFLQKVRQAIEANYMKSDFDVAALAQQLQMSRMQLYRKLKAVSNQTVAQLIRDIRLEKAKILLQNEQLNISEIAYELGYSDPNYFTRQFSQAFQQSPNSYRKSL